MSRLKLKLKDQQASMRKLIAKNDKVLQRSPRREWAGDMPKVKVPKGGGTQKVKVAPKAKTNKVVNASKFNKPIESGRKARIGEMFDGSFGSKTLKARAAYADGDSLQKVVHDRISKSTEIGPMGNLSRDKQAAFMSGIEHGITSTGISKDSVRYIEVRDLAKRDIAITERRDDGYIIRINTSALEWKSIDEIEQIAFHEVAHVAENEAVSSARAARDARNLSNFRKGRSAKLKIQGSSEIAEKALKDAGYDAFYSDFNGKIMLGENLEKELSELPLYATDGAEYGTQDSELIAECIRFVFVHGFGKNGIADAIAKAFV